MHHRVIPEAPCAHIQLRLPHTFALLRLQGPMHFLKPRKTFIFPEMCVAKNIPWGCEPEPLIYILCYCDFTCCLLLVAVFVYRQVAVFPPWRSRVYFPLLESWLASDCFFKVHRPQWRELSFYICMYMCVCIYICVCVCVCVYICFLTW